MKFYSFIKQMVYVIEEKKKYLLEESICNPQPQLKQSNDRIHF